MYHVERTVQEAGTLFGDGSHIIYVNGSYKNDNDPVGKLMHDFRCTSAADMFYQELADPVRHFKETEGGRSQVCKAVEEFSEKIAVERANEEKNSIAVKMLKAGKYALEEISNLTGLTLLEVQDLQRTLQVVMKTKQTKKAEQETESRETALIVGFSALIKQCDTF